MTQTFDPGPVGEPYASLVDAYPGAEVYPPAAFRLEWGRSFTGGGLTAAPACS